MSATSNSERPGTKRALLVDDHDLFRGALGVVLEHHAGFGRSVHAGSLVEARRALEGSRNGSEGRFDFAVVDLDLPGGGGLELLAELREAAPGAPVIAVTADPDHGLRARASGAGASEVLATSASGAEVVEAARRLEGMA